MCNSPNHCSFERQFRARQKNLYSALVLHFAIRKRHLRYRPQRATTRCSSVDDPTMLILLQKCGHNRFPCQRTPALQQASGRTKGCQFMMGNDFTQGPEHYVLETYGICHEIEVPLQLQHGIRFWSIARSLYRHFVLPES